MANAKTATLSSLLVSKKAADAPARPAHPGLEEAQTLPSVAAAGSSLINDSDTPRYYKALTLKVDKDRFTKLKNLGVQRDLRSQALMTEALDLLFAKHNL
jgi:hypothetical protein